MKSLFLLSGILLILSSCGVRESGGDRTLTHGSAAAELRARMQLRVIEEQGLQRKLAIVLQNPGRVPVQSVRAWVQFDPRTTGVSDLTIEDGRFVLFAPGERTIDPAEGFVKIGAAVRSPIPDSVITLATFTVTLSEGAEPVLTFYDWRERGDGHTAVLTVEGSSVNNILAAPSAIAL